MATPDLTTDEERLEALGRRSWVLAGVAALATAVLLVRLGSLQLLQGRHYLALAQDQGIRRIAVPAPRGKILDRNGVVLAADRPSFTAALVYTRAAMSDAEVALLSRILSISPDVIRRADAERRQVRPYEPVRLKTDLTPEEQTQLEEHRGDLPGVVVTVEPMRSYPLGALAAHVLGYVGRGDSPVDVEGKYGLEATYNGPIQAAGRQVPGLAGVDGALEVEVDHLGRPVRTLGSIPPQPGDNLVLTLDAHLQQVAEDALNRQLQALRTQTFDNLGPFPADYGAVVALDVRSGAILALASEPAFDPNDFARAAHVLPGTEDFRRWQAEWQSLASPDNRGRPLIDHALADLTPPGSTFKPVTALAALQANVITPGERVPCPAFVRVGPLVKRNWEPGQGALNLQEAIGRSCDTYFYTVGVETGIDRIENLARAFGLGSPTGLRDLAGEASGYVAGPDTKRRLGYRDPWYPAETMDAAIGQGFTAATVLQLADYAATLANGGTRYAPYLVQEVTDPQGRVLARFGPRVVGRVDLPAPFFDAVRQAMAAVTEQHPEWAADGVSSPFGTAWWPFRDFPSETRAALGRVIRVAAKTGTAEVPGHATNGVFICFAPADDPQIAVAAYVREGGEGAFSGAPVARAILDAYFGLPSAAPAEAAAAASPQAAGSPIRVPN